VLLQALINRLVKVLSCRDVLVEDMGQTHLERVHAAMGGAASARGDCICQ
jgi:hypothetical protein